MSPKPQRVAIYLRVSKDDGSQETDNQLLQLREFCDRWEGHELVAEYVDRESGTRAAGSARTSTGCSPTRPGDASTCCSSERWTASAGRG